jgi:hypothetical protein
MLSRSLRSVSRAFLICVWAAVWTAAGALAADSGVKPRIQNGQMTADEAKQLGEEFGIVVDEVDEEIRNILKMVRAEGVAVFEVIGGSRADLAGIKVKAVIKEIDKIEVKNLIDFGKALKRAMNECNFTVGTYEPADPGDPVGWGVNFHFVGCKQD